ncbi:MAG: hypothetical protein U0Z75_05950 [Deinococcaceae bacterium]
MKKYIVIGLLLMLGKGMATTGIPLDTEICKPGMGVEVEKGNASVGIKERGSYCNVEVGGDSVDIFGLKSDYCIEGPLDDGCEESPGVEIPSGTEKSDTSKTGKMPDGLKWYEVPGALGGGRYSRRSDSCVYRSNFSSSTPSSSVFSSLSACSPGGSSSGGNAQSPKKDPKQLEKDIKKDQALFDKALPLIQADCKSIHCETNYGGYDTRADTRFTSFRTPSRSGSGSHPEVVFKFAVDEHVTSIVLQAGFSKDPSSPLILTNESVVAYAGEDGKIMSFTYPPGITFKDKSAIEASIRTTLERVSGIIEDIRRRLNTRF